MLSLICPIHSHLKWVWAENENIVNLCVFRRTHAFTWRFDSCTFTKKPRFQFHFKIRSDWVWEETGAPGGNPRRQGDSEQALHRQAEARKKPVPSAVKPQCQNWPLSHHAAHGRCVRVSIAQLSRSPENHAKETLHNFTHPQSMGETQLLKFFLNHETRHLKQFLFFFPFFFGPMSSENQRTFKSPAVLQNAQFRRKWGWMSLTTCGWVLRCLPVTVGGDRYGLWRLVQPRLKD